MGSAMGGNGDLRDEIIGSDQEDLVRLLGIG